MDSFANCLAHLRNGKPFANTFLAPEQSSNIDKYPGGSESLSILNCIAILGIDIASSGQRNSNISGGAGQESGVGLINELWGIVRTA
jgi:hypothetical protein